MKRDFFITWSAQNTVSTLDVAEVEDSAFLLNDGSRILDFLSTSFQTNFGHRNTRIVEAIERQLRAMPISLPKAVFSLKSGASAELKRLLGFDSGKVFYTCSGAESVENALKMARQYSGKNIVLARRKSYHGATLGALSVTGDWRNELHSTVDDWTVRIPEPSEDTDCSQTRKIIEDLGAENIAAFCLETITGANGVIIPPEKWWRGIEQACEDFGLLLIVDEVLCGFGRTGKNFAFQHYQLKPDFVCMSKGITGGYVPFGAVWVCESVSNHYGENVLSCGLTNYAHPLGLAAMSAVTDLLNDPKFCSEAEDKVKIISERLLCLEKNKLVSGLRHRGFLAALELNNSDTIDWNEFVDAGIHLLCKPGLLIVSPPLTMSEEDLHLGFDRIEKVLERRG